MSNPIPTDSFCIDCRMHTYIGKECKDVGKHINKCIRSKERKFELSLIDAKRNEPKKYELMLKIFNGEPIKERKTRKRKPAKVIRLEPIEIEPEKNERTSHQYEKWRRAVLKRDGRKCILCQYDKFLNAHHIVRWIDNESLRYDVNNGATVCMTCHIKWHGPQNKPFPELITNRLIKHIKEVNGEIDKYHGFAISK